MNWAIHTKGPTAAADLRAALEAARDELLGTEEKKAKRQAQLLSLSKAAKEMPDGEAKSALEAAYASLATAPPVGITDDALRAAVEKQCNGGIDAACAIASGHVHATISGSAARVDEDIESRISIHLDTVDLAGMAARLERETPAEKSIITEGSVSAPPI